MPLGVDTGYAKEVAANAGNRRKIRKIIVKTLAKSERFGFYGALRRAFLLSFIDFKKRDKYDADISTDKYSYR